MPFSITVGRSLLEQTEKIVRDTASEVGIAASSKIAYTIQIATHGVFGRLAVVSGGEVKSRERNRKRKKSGLGLTSPLSHYHPVMVAVILESGLFLVAIAFLN